MNEFNYGLHIMRKSEGFVSVIKIGEFQNVDTFRKALKDLKKLLVTCDKKWQLDFNRNLVRYDYYIIINE